MNDGAITVVEYESAHQPYFEQLYRSWFTKHFGLAPEAVDEFMLTEPEKAILKKGGAILVLLHNDRLAGMVALKKEDGHSFELTKMAIGEEYRGKGLGEVLSRAAIGKARTLGAKRIVLYTHSSLRAAINLYLKLGFEEIPLETGHYSSFRCDLKMELWLDKLNNVKTTNMELIAPLKIPIRRTSHSLLGEVDWDNLEFGKYSTDHMLVCDYAGGEWGMPQILPFGDFSLSPSALCFHYGQTVFEGMKAFRQADGKINIFRPDKHYDRLQLSAERLCMPTPPREIFVEGLRQLVALDKSWVPSSPGSALYLRPFIIATEARLGVKISDTYRFAIVCTPSGPLYPQPIRVKVEKDFVRASRGGTGYAKCGGNYGAAFYPARKAREEGYDQVLWTDGKENRYIEESGTMNVLFVINRKLVTPPLSDSILDGVTRDSLIALAGREGITVDQRPVCIEELQLAFEEGTITEAFGAGTAAVVSPIRTIGIGGVDHDLPSFGQRSLAHSLRAKLDDIRYGKVADPFGWNDVIGDE